MWFSKCTVHVDRIDIEPILSAIAEAIADLKQTTIQQGDRIMSAVSDFSAKVESNFATIKAGIDALDAKIVAFQNSPGTLSPDDQAALDQIVADSANLAQRAGTMPSAAGPPTGTPPPTPVP
jgi:hypothetical protein